MVFVGMMTRLLYVCVGSPDDTCGQQPKRATRALVCCTAKFGDNSQSRCLYHHGARRRPRGGGQFAETDQTSANPSVFPSRSARRSSASSLPIKASREQSITKV